MSKNKGLLGSGGPLVALLAADSAPQSLVVRTRFEPYLEVVAAENGHGRRPVQY